MLLAAFIVVAALLIALLTQGDERAQHDYYRQRLSQNPPTLPPASVIVPVKGPEPNLAANLSALASLDYPDYELLIAVRSPDDLPAGVTPPSARVVVASRPLSDTGEKINNLLAAVRAARPQSQVLAFADSDGLVPPGWLQALVAPLEEEGVGAVTGYRYHVPPPPAGFWSLMRSAWNGVVAGSLQAGNNAFCWGGATAITRRVFKKARVEDYWRGAVSDDYRLSEAVHEIGLTIAFAPGALTADTTRTTAREFLAWAARQLVITRVYRPRLWWYGLAAHFLYCASWPAALYAAWHGQAWGPLAWGVQVYLGMKKASRRTRLIRSAMPAHDAWFRRYRWLLIWLTPLATWVWFLTLLLSARTRTIQWRGNTYHLRSLPPPRSSR